MISQISKFGVVGVISFLIDYGLFRTMNYIFDIGGVTNIFSWAYMISGVIGFSVSVIVNYLLSMKYVFVRRDDLSQRKEFVIFVALSVVGLLLNEICLYIGMDVIYRYSESLRNIVTENIMKNYNKKKLEDLSVEEASKIIEQKKGAKNE